MIKNIINNAVQSNSRLLDESKDKVISMAKKRAEEQYGDKIPTPTDLKNELESYRAEIVTPANVIKAEQKFNKFISLCDKTISKLDSGIKELNAIKGKVDKTLGIPLATEFEGIFILETIVKKATKKGEKDEKFYEVVDENNSNLYDKAKFLDESGKLIQEDYLLKRNNSHKKQIKN